MTAPPVFWPLILWLRASTLAEVGRPVDALAAVDGAIALAEGPTPDVLGPQFAKLRGDILLVLGQMDEAGAWYRQAIEFAHLTRARMTELQATTALVRMSADGERRGVLDQLRRLYDTFTEGFDAPDVVAARELIGS
jgi:tetratricopeptide (TPR) repeat protein